MDILPREKNIALSTNSLIKTKNNSNILDPLSVIIKLSIYGKKDIGTKLCVFNNVLHIQDIGIFQSFVRFINNNSKNDLLLLYNPIELACKYFLLENLNKYNNNIKKIFVDAKTGIENLIKLYKDFPIVYNLYIYYNILVNYLEEIYNDKLFIADTNTDYYTKELSNKLNSNWTSEKVEIVLSLLDYINTNNKNINCINEFLTQIDIESINIIKN